LTLLVVIFVVEKALRLIPVVVVALEVVALFRLKEEYVGVEGSEGDLE